uniref:Uncharacterized protein n=1 Tax=Panagrolaimus davidi TaxID=227884 RepID=A0A914PRE1_9BILA
MPSNMEIVKFCCEGSVLSQCKNIVRDKNKRWRLFWFAVFIVTLAAGLWYGSTAIQDYLSYPSHARFYDAEIQDLPFPAVTICNLNPMDKNKNIFDKNIKELMILYRYYASQLTNSTSTPPKKEAMNSRFKRAFGSIYTVNLNDTVCAPQTTTAAVTTTEESTTTTDFTTTQEPTTVLTSKPEVTSTAASTTIAIETTTPVFGTTTVSTAESTLASTSLAASTTISQPPTSDALEFTKTTQPQTSDASVTSSLTLSQSTDTSASTTRNAQSTTTVDTLTSDASTTAKQAQSSTSDASATTLASQAFTAGSSETTKQTESPISDTSATTMLTRLPKTDEAKQTTTMPQSPNTNASASTTRNAQSTTTVDTLTSDASTTAKQAQSSTSDASATTLASQAFTAGSSETTKQTESPISDTSATTMLTRLPKTDEAKQTTTMPQSPNTNAETTLIITTSSTIDKSSFETTTLTQSSTTENLKQTTKPRETSITDKSAVGTTTPSSQPLTTDESQSSTNLDHSSSGSSSTTTIMLTQSPTTDTSNSKTLKIQTTKPTTPPHGKTESPISDTALTTKATSVTQTAEATAESTFTETTSATISTSTVAKVLSSATQSSKSAASTSTSASIPSETTLTHPSSVFESSTTEQYTTAFPYVLLSEKVPSSTTTFKSTTSQPTSDRSSSAIELENPTTASQMQTQEYTTIPSTKMTTASLSKTTPSSTNSFENIFTSNEITTSPTLPSEIQPTTVHGSIVSTTSYGNKNDATTFEQNIQVSSTSATTANQMQTQKYSTIPYTIDRGDGTSLTGLTTTVSHSSPTEKTEPLFETSTTGPSITSTSTKTTHVSTGSTSSAAVSTNEKPNESTGSPLSKSSKSPSDDETGSSSSSKLPSTLSDVTRSTTFNSELITSTPSSIESTTPEPIVFEIYTQKQINELETKYKINSTSTSRIALEAKIQDRLVGMMRINQTGGYGIKDIIIQCTFDKDECDMDNDFLQMYDPWYGNCYTFNYDGRYGITRAGTDFGLKMLVFSNISEYMETSSRSGFKIVLHRQGYAPFPNSDGLYVKTGKHSTINVKYRSFEALPAPYGICQPDKNTTGYIYDGYYTAEGCLRSCYQHKIIENCSCADPRYPKPKGSNVSWCDGTNLKNFLCYANYLETQGDFVKVSSCYCPPGCHKHTFNHNIATSNWPIKREPFVTPMCNGYWPKTNIKCYDAYENNAAMIGISHLRLLYRKTMQEADYWWWDVFEMFMGNLGLFTGITCLAAFEFLEFFILLLWRPQWISEEEEEETDGETDDNEMTEMPRKKDNKIYDSNMIEENSMDIPLPFIGGHTSTIGLEYVFFKGMSAFIQMTLTNVF